MALKALGASKDEAAVPALEAALDDPERSVRSAAALALGHIGRETMAKVVAAHAAVDIRFETLGKRSRGEAALTSCIASNIHHMRSGLEHSRRSHQKEIVDRICRHRRITATFFALAMHMAYNPPSRLVRAEQRRGKV